MFEVIVQGKRFLCTRDFTFAVGHLLKGAGEMMKPNVTTRKEINRKNFITHEIVTEYGSRLYVMWFYEVWNFARNIRVLKKKNYSKPKAKTINKGFLKFGRECAFVDKDSGESTSVSECSRPKENQSAYDCISGGYSVWKCRSPKN